MYERVIAPVSYRGPNGFSATSQGEDIGLQSPLAVAEASPVGRAHALELRWLAASVIVAVTGGAMLGFSLYGAVGSADVESPELAARPIVAESSASGGGHKGDKLVHAELAVATRRSFRASATEHASDRDVVKSHAYQQVTTSLSVLAGDAGATIPPLETVTQPKAPGVGADPQPGEAEAGDPADPSVGIVTADLAFEIIGPDAPSLSDADAAAQVVEIGRMAKIPSSQPVEFATQRFLSRTMRIGQADRATPDEAGDLPSMEVRIVPDNLTSFSRSPNDAAPVQFEERDAVLREGETIETVLRSIDAPPERIARIMAALSRHAQGDLKAGQHVRLLLAPEGARRGVERVILYGEAGIEETVAARDDGRFVAVARADSDKPAARGPDADEDDDEPGQGTTLYQSVYTAGLKNGVPRPLIEEAIRAFATAIDFQHRTGAGDRLELFFKHDDEARPELLYAALTLGRETHQLYSYRPDYAGEPDYFDETGRSLKKFLMRRPVAEGRISSPFGSRYHPILGYTRMHNGVDWAAPRGTPIMAAGGGTIEAAGLHSGYGNRVEIRHANGYATAYNHMARFARGIAPGAHVRFGEVIGWVGTTGLSTGPHVHYEVTINGRFVDPMKIRLPSGRELDGSALAGFLRDERQIDDLRRHAGTGSLASRG